MPGAAREKTSSASQFEIFREHSEQAGMKTIVLMFPTKIWTVPCSGDPDRKSFLATLNIPSLWQGGTTAATPLKSFAPNDMKAKTKNRCNFDPWLLDCKFSFSVDSIAVFCGLYPHLLENSFHHCLPVKCPKSGFVSQQRETIAHPIYQITLKISKT